HPSGRHLLVANYGSGQIAVLAIQPDGSLGEATDVVAPQGTLGPARAAAAAPGSFAVSGHTGSHAHMIATDPSGRFVLSTDLGYDRVYVWTLDTNTGKLSPAQHLAGGFCRIELCILGFGQPERPVSLLRQPAAQQRQHLRHGRQWRAAHD